VGYTETMQRHRSERKGEHANDKDRCSENLASGCPEEANTQKKSLAKADLVRDTALTRCLSMRPLGSELSGWTLYPNP